MILVDTSVWIDFFRRGEESLAQRIEASEILIHPFVIGELALGRLNPREQILREMEELPRPVIASDQEVLHMIDRYRLAGSDIGYIDAHLLASALLSIGTVLWTRDRKLLHFVHRLGLAAPLV